MKLSQLRGMPVICSDNGAKIGTIYDVLIDTNKLEVTALLVGRHSGMGVLRLNTLSHVGEDAITMDNSNAVEWAITRPKSAHCELGDLTKLPVVDAQGIATGVLHDVNIDLPSGTITSLDVRVGSLFGPLAKKGDVPVSDVISVGPTLVTVRHMIEAE